MSDTPAEEVALGDTRAAILAHVRDHPGARPKAIAEGSGVDYATVRQTARRMASDGQLHADPSGGYYVPVTAVTAVTHQGLTSENASNTAVTGLSPLSLEDKDEDQ